jgi:hypothetical protein
MIALNPVDLFDMGFGPRMIPVVPPQALIGSSGLTAAALGKAPGYPTDHGWVPLNLKNPAFRCADYVTAKRWRDDWGANVGFVAGDGFVVVDNDQGVEFSEALIRSCNRIGLEPLRRFVADPKHKRDAFLFFVGGQIRSSNTVFRNGTRIGKVQLLANNGQQAVIAGTHRDTLHPYVWDRKVASIDEVPVLSEGCFLELMKKFGEDLANSGWASDGGAFVSRSLSPAQGLSLHQAHQVPITPTLEEIQDTKALLDAIPNRDVPAGETPNEIDLWLDDYVNWTKVAYALAAHLSASAGSPEAEALWTEWSDGRTQVKQTSQAVWRSVIRQPSKFGGIRLVQIVKELDALPPAPFPDVDPNDPAFKARPTPLWDKIREKWALHPSGQFLDMATGTFSPRAAFADRYAARVKTLADEMGRVPKKRTKLNAATLFVEHPARKAVSGLTYDPGAPRLIDVPGGNPIFNSWRPTDVQPTRQVSPAEVRMWLDHVEYIVGPAECDRFVKWCAFVAQKPELKPSWHYMIMGQQGFGKDTTLAPVKRAVGRKNYKEAIVQQVGNQFNEVLETKLLIVGETHQPKWTAHEVASNLKHILARPPDTYTINRKNIPQYEVANRIAAILFSNDANPILLERGQRRIAVVNRRDATPRTKGYYDMLWDWLNLGGTELAAAYLLTLPLTAADIGSFTGGNAPSSGDKAALEELSVDPVLFALEGLIRDARAGIGPFTNLLATATQLAEHTGLRNKPSSQVVSGWLMDMEHRKQGVVRVRVNPKNPTDCSPVHTKNGAARLWALTDKAPDGRAWSVTPSVEIVARWQGKPIPKSAAVLAFPQPAKGNGLAEEEPV